jgi:lysophospholipid acyltransferase (LPLAT)-like uncharacterized protein
VPPVVAVNVTVAEVAVGFVALAVTTGVGVASVVIAVEAAVVAESFVDRAELLYQELTYWFGEPSAITATL